MSNINYGDLHKVYHHIFTKTEKPQVPVKKEVTVELVETEEPKEEVRTPPPEPVYFHTVTHDPLRELLPTAAGFAVGWKLADLLLSGGKNYVGNQHISSMSKERVQEYRRLGLLPPPD